MGQGRDRGRALFCSPSFPPLPCAPLPEAFHVCSMAVSPCDYEVTADICPAAQCGVPVPQDSKEFQSCRHWPQYNHPLYTALGWSSPPQTAFSSTQ